MQTALYPSQPIRLIVLFLSSGGNRTVPRLVAVVHVAYTPVVTVASTTTRLKTLADVVAASKSAPDSITDSTMHAEVNPIISLPGAKAAVQAQGAKVQTMPAKPFQSC